MSSLSVVVGIDLGSTTTKAVILDEDRRVVGKGITNSRSNYDVASRVAREEAFVQARFFLAHDAIEGDAGQHYDDECHAGNANWPFNHQSYGPRAQIPLPFIGSRLVKAFITIDAIRWIMLACGCVT